MSATNDGGSVSPNMLNNGEGVVVCEGGLSIRDWFAGMALQGLLAHVIGVENGTPTKYGLRSYEYADAMLAARDGKESA